MAFNGNEIPDSATQLWNIIF